jgi:hypothetical protein
VYVVNAETGKELPGWPQHMLIAPGKTAAIESSPTIAWLDGPKRPPSIIVGAASTWVSSTAAEVEAFHLDGAVRFVFHVGLASHTSAGVISSPAVGDVLGNGQMQVVFGSWDHHIYVLDSHGNQLGFAYDNADTIWSSPALYKLPGQAGEDIFLGSDASGRPYGNGQRCVGGFLADYRWSNSTVDPDTLKAGPGLSRQWFHCMNQSIWSSPVVGLIGSSHRPVVVVGTSFFEQPFPSDTNKVFAFDAATGVPVPGWPVSTAGPALGSPAIGVIDGSSEPSVVETSWHCTGGTEASCFAGNVSMVYAWNGKGQQLWVRPLPGPTTLSSPVLVPLSDSGFNDVLVGTPAGLYPLSGATGAFLYGTNGDNQFAAINNGCRVFNSVAVAQIAGIGAASGWHAFEACGGPPVFHQVGEVANYRLPVQNLGVDAWPMFRGSPSHSGVAFSSLLSPPLTIPGLAPIDPTAAS